MRQWILASLALSSAASAQAPVPPWNPKAPENRQLLPSFNLPAVEGVLDAIRARHQRGAGKGAAASIIVTFANNRKAVISFGACEQDGGACKAISIQSFWTKMATVPPLQVAGAIEQFNRRYAFSKAFVASDGRPALQRYLTADYGFIRGNLAVNLLVFASQADRFAAEVLLPLQGPR
jgi:hypothetical protein